MTRLFIPIELIEWIDRNRGDLSRQTYILKCLSKLKEIVEMNK